MKESLLYDIALPLLPEVGTKRAKELYSFFGCSRDVFEADEKTLLSIPNIAYSTVREIISGRANALKRAKREVEFVEKHQIETYLFTDSAYPERLSVTPDAPYLLYGKGNTELSKGYFLSVVGTRTPSHYGVDMCNKIISDLAKIVPNLTIVSGLAYGIDVTAHRAALDNGLPTIIIPGHGLDRIYPAINRPVAIKALENGGILTEYMSGTEPERTNFIARNRIIAGLGHATLVIESKAKGGSLITAEITSSYGRELLAVPGRVGDVFSEGCNKIIKHHQAQMVESGEDIVRIMNWDRTEGAKEAEKTVQLNLFGDLSETEQEIVNLYKDEEELHINDIIQRMKISYNELTVLLMQLEMQGAIRSLPGGMYRLIRKK